MPYTEKNPSTPCYINEITMINPVLLPIVGNLAIHWYGVMIACGVMLAIYLSQNALIKSGLLTAEQYHQILVSSIIAGFIGGKLIYLITEENGALLTISHFFEGGFSILGTILGIALTLPFLLRKYHKPIFPILDIIVTVAPLIQCFGRIGCFIAGCCYGCKAATSLSVTYTHSLSLAPLGIPLYPIQLYSAGALFMIFIIMQISARYYHRPGYLTCLYLILLSLERFIIDFWRDDRIWTSVSSILSFHQLFALGFMGIGLCILILIIKRDQ